MYRWDKKVNYVRKKVVSKNISKQPQHPIIDEWIKM